MSEKNKTDGVDAMFDRLKESHEKNKDNPEFKKHMKELTKSVDDYKHRHDDARKYGKRIAQGLIKKYKSIPVKCKGKMYNEKGLETDDASAAIAEILFNCYMADPECGRLLNEWTHNKLWGKIVMEHIPTIKEIWQYLHDNKYTKNNTLGFGDADGAIWVEYPRQEEEWPDERKIIIHKSYCTCADDDAHIFILDDSNFVSKFNLLHVRTVWPRENPREGYRVKKSKKHPKGWFSWGDDRDIKIPSLNTYRKRNFKFSYQDGRDKGYILTLQAFGTPSIEWAYNYQSRIEHVVSLINYMKLIITDESCQCK